MISLGSFMGKGGNMREQFKRTAKLLALVALVTQLTGCWFGFGVRGEGVEIEGGGYENHGGGGGEHGSKEHGH